MRYGSILTFVFLFAPIVPAQTPEQKKATIKFLQELQAPDGGFLPAPVDPRLDVQPRGGLRATSAAVRALKYFGGAPKDKEAAAKFVKSCYGEKTHGFSEQPGGEPDVFTSAVGLMAVVELGLPTEPFIKAVDFITVYARGWEEVRIAAASFEAVGKLPFAAKRWAEETAESSNKDLTFGSGAGKARATAGSVVTILRLGGKVGDRRRTATLDALNAGQNKDGGFGKDDSGASDLETSYRVMRCYHMLKAKPAKSDALAEYVVKCRNNDGGYGVQPGKPSQVGGTYYAGIILKWLNDQ